MSISFYDYETKTSWSYNGDTFFHAASTIKVAILLGVFSLINDGKIKLDSQVKIKNDFFSLINNIPFRIEPSRDSNSTVYSFLGQTLSVSELAYHMITTSSNLATNLLIDLVGIDSLQEKLKELGIEGIDLKRGVEDELAYQQNINNLVTGNGLLKLFRYLYESAKISDELRIKMLDILLSQKFNQGIPIGIPLKIRNHTKFAHKTGEISTVFHDAGLVFLPNRKPYVIVILTERIPSKSKSRRAVQNLSRLVYKNFIATEFNEPITNHES